MAMWVLWLLLAVGAASGNVWSSDSEETGEGITIGIVGAGLGGASSAYFLRQALPNATIVVFEKDTIGGRIRSVDFSDVKNIETGGSTWHSSHQQMNELCEALGIKVTNPLKRTDGSTSGPYGVWNGRDIVFKQSASDVGMVLSMIWRYGLSPLYSQRLVDEVSDKLEEVYSLLSNSHPWTSHEDLLRQLHLYDTSQQDLRSLLRNNGFNAAFMDEIVEGIIRSNYGQPLSGTNALAGLLAMKSGADELYAAKNGNVCIVEELLRQSQVDIMNETRVVSIHRTNRENASQSVILKYDKLGAENTAHFDAVVMAAPADLADIDIFDSRHVRYQTNPNHYVITHVTLVLCNGLSPHYFRLLKSESDPSLLLTMEEDVAVFSSLGLYKKLHSQAVYKILSRELLTEELLDKMFINKTDVMRHTWHAYPELKQLQSYPPLKIDEYIYYPSGFERVLPLMEGVVLSARNVVNMLLGDVKEIKRIKEEEEQRAPVPSDEEQEESEEQDEAKSEERLKEEKGSEEGDNWYEYISNIVTESFEDEQAAEGQKKKEVKQEAKPEPAEETWLSSFFTSKDVKPEAPKQEEKQEPPEDKAEDTWLSSLFSSPDPEPAPSSEPEVKGTGAESETGSWSWFG
eukprot:TRINITY_DN19239_c0_g1_i2.p1 TRINITY_DN19239_c0_g1~~TRINITY_DN19239_c0_g1_i2.p1  ORF type:complete len:629 (+),score=195.81 TRINITY_DN19239_c0_g1_i2:48-1934(+)